MSTDGAGVGSNEDDDDMSWLWDMRYLVFKGASVMGLSYIGFVSRLQDVYRRFGRNMHASMQGFGGSSIGALMALVMSLDPDLDEVRAYVLERDFSEIVSRMHIGTLHASKGLVDNGLLQEWVGDFLARWTGDADMTFRQHAAATGKRLRVVASDVSSSRSRGDEPVYVFDADSAPDCTLRFAVATSMAIPIIFSPSEHDGRLLVDGGLFNNFPMDLFPLAQTVGIRVRSLSPPLTDTVLQYTFQVFASCHEMLEEATLRLIPRRHHRQIFTIQIAGVPFYNFQVTADIKRSLMDDGWAFADRRFAGFVRSHDERTRVPRLVTRCIFDMLLLSFAVRPAPARRAPAKALESSIDVAPRPGRSAPRDIPLPAETPPPDGQ